MSLTAQDLTLSGRLACISAALRAGEVTAICGPNGAGKSSLLACLSGLLAAESGAISLDGEPLAKMPPRTRARAIGYLPQASQAAWDMTVDVMVALGRLPWQGTPLARAAASREQNRAAVETALAAMDLLPLRARPLSRLSGGEAARAHLARVLAGEPQWLLADEPLANLDLAHAQTLIATLKAQAAGGCGVVLVLHDLASAMNHADRVIVLHEGAVAADGPPHTALSAEVIARCWGVTARWLGAPGAMALAVG